MEKFIIEGGVPLLGEVTPSGNKNAALPILTACLLTEDSVILHNVPQIMDVLDMRKLLESLGVYIESLEGNTWKVTARDVSTADLDPDLCRRIRASILLAGPMLARTGTLYLPPPGGDVIGRRRLDTHLLALQAIGAEIKYGRVMEFRTKELKGTNLLLDEASVTATENVVMAAVTARGHTIIRNAASEPHVQELCNILNQMGAKIENVGSNTIHIEGVNTLHGTEYTIGADLLEVISLVGAAAVTRGQILIHDAGVAHLEMVAQVFRRMGVEWEVQGQDILVPEKQSLRVISDVDGAIPEIKTNVWPAFPTDLMSIAITVATQTTGSVLFHDWMFSGRMYFTDKLVGMGARVILCDPYRCLIQGPNQLIAEKLESPDIRAGMALLLATLAAKGTSTIRNVRQIDRGYERVDEKLTQLGAKIERAIE
jgi:UDP-N-acetylglucosamine 1-carboxyvinyltransferase